MNEAREAIWDAFGIIADAYPEFQWSTGVDKFGTLHVHLRCRNRKRQVMSISRRIDMREMDLGTEEYVTHILFKATEILSRALS